jgi:hypothetical protein
MTYKQAEIHAMNYFDMLTKMGLKPSYADPNVWMQYAGECYECVCLYVHDLTVILKQPELFFEELKK